MLPQAEHRQQIEGQILPLCSALVRHIWVSCPVLGSPVRETWTCWSEFSKD